MQGLVIKNTGSDIKVRFSDGFCRLCKLKGALRTKGFKSTNPVVVGDLIEVDENNQISRILPRKNHIARRPTNLSKQIHVIAANIDTALLVFTIKEPETSLVFIDRFLASAEAYRVNTILVINKIDLLGEQDKHVLAELVEKYAKIGYKSFMVSALDSSTLEEIRREIAGKVVLLSGNSGVGKSTLINALIGEQRAKTSQISAIHKKGMHTTTFSEIYELPQNTYIIDTPGIKGFGVVDMEKDEISHYFVEIFSCSKRCRYPNCTHIHEPDCAVLKAIERGEISHSRYNSYLSMIEEVSLESKYR